MNTRQVTLKSGHVTTEGDDLIYEVRGQGQPPLMIAPAGGDGWQYSFVADLLADEYKVITYDRRANARSTMNVPQNFERSASRAATRWLCCVRPARHVPSFLAIAAVRSLRWTWQRPSLRRSEQ